MFPPALPRPAALTSSAVFGADAPIGLRSEATSAADVCPAGFAAGAVDVADVADVAGFSAFASAEPDTSVGGTGRVSVSGFGGMLAEPSAVPATGLAVGRGVWGVAGST